MKKLFLMMGMVCLFMVACNNQPKQDQQKAVANQTDSIAEKHQCPFCALKAEYADWANMDEAKKVELNNKAIALFEEMDKKMAECEAKGEGKPCCKEGKPELTEEQKAECETKCAQMKAIMERWAGIEAMTNDEQKDLVLERIAAMGMGEGKCGNHEGEGHQCQHGEGHQCDHAK